MTQLSDREPPSSLDELCEVPTEPDWRAMEARLLAAFPAARASTALSSAANRPTARLWTTQRWHWAVAAAMVVMAAAITFYPAPTRYATPLDTSKPPAPSPQPATPTSAEPVHPAPPPVAPPPRPKGRAPRTTVLRQPPSNSTVENFVALPNAVGLPALESGRIVRMEVPLTVLPAYGLEVVPDATPGPVQADFLIGQDGVPRAIRLAANSQR